MNKKQNSTAQNSATFFFFFFYVFRISPPSFALGTDRLSGIKFVYQDDSVDINL